MDAGEHSSIFLDGRWTNRIDSPALFLANNNCWLATEGRNYQWCNNNGVIRSNVGDSCACSASPDGAGCVGLWRDNGEAHPGITVRPICGTCMHSAPTPALGGLAWACHDTPGMVVETLGWDCPTAFSTLTAMGGCDYDLSILAPTLPSATFLRDACPVSCDNCPDPPATGCVIGADDADGILASGVLPLDCATMISLIMQTTVEAACGTDGTDGMDLSAVAMIYAAVPAFDPTVMIADACMATCGTCMADTDGSMTAPPDSPVQPVVETLTTALAGGGYTTYQLALEGNTALASNVYALYGDASNGGPALTMPPAYQVGAPFGADIAGVNPAFFAFMADAQYDSWITVGITESDTTNAISSIGLNFTTWTETTPLTTSDGSIFWMTPTDGPDFATTPVVVIAQLTVATGTSFDAMVSVQGAAASGVLGDTWTAEGVTFRV